MEHKFENIASDVLMLNYKTPDNWDFSYHLTYNDLLRIINWSIKQAILFAKYTKIFNK